MLSSTFRRAMVMSLKKAESIWKIATNNFVNEIGKRLPDERISIMLIGSVVRDEAIPIWSDIDIVLYLHGMNAVTADILRKIKTSLWKSKGNQQMWIKVHTPDSFPNSLNPMTVINYNTDGKMLYGKDIKPLLARRIERITQADIRNSVIGKMISERFYFRYYYTGMDDKNMELGCTHIKCRKGCSRDMLAAQIIDRIIENCQNALYFKGTSPTNKTDIVNEFSKQYKTFKLSNVPVKLNGMRKRWGKLRKSDYNFIFSDKPIDFIEKLTDMIVKGNGHGSLT
jgi:predicted nucleotidyltransferase